MTYYLLEYHDISTSDNITKIESDINAVLEQSPYEYKIASRAIEFLYGQELQCIGHVAMNINIESEDKYKLEQLLEEVIVFHSLAYNQTVTVRPVSKDNFKLKTTGLN